jgi:hypothetical protein
LLAALQRGDFLAGRILKIHRKEQGSDHQAGHAGGNILADLEPCSEASSLTFWLLASISAVMAVQSEYRSCG